MYLKDDQYLGGLTANNTRNKVAEYFLRDAGAASYSRCQKYEQWSTKSKKKKHVCMNVNQLCSINYGNAQQKLFFEHLLQLLSLLKGKYKLLPIHFFCFVSVFVNITRDINNSISNSKSPIFTTGRLLFQFCTDTALESYRSDTAG